jgi:hypothetical protein
MKPHWAMTHIEYGHLFADVELFIIFGCSLGGTDGWWWRRILGRLRNEPADAKAASEVVIYWWSRAEAPESSADIVERFFGGLGVAPHDPIRQRVLDQIHVVVYTDLDPRSG